MLLFLLKSYLLFALLIGSVSYFFLRSQMKRFQKIYKIQQNPKEEYLPFIRKDFKLWNLSNIYIGCFVRLPYKIIITLIVFIGLLIQFILTHFLQKIASRRLNIMRKSIYLFVNVICKPVIYLICKYESIYLNNPPLINESIIISNHITFFEFAYILMFNWPVSLVAKKEVEGIPIAGTLCKFLDSFFINREDEAQKSQLLKKIKQRCQSTKRGQTPPLLIFPEGTTTNGQYLISFKKGAFEPLHRIRIYGFKYQCENFNVSMDEGGLINNIILFYCQSPSVKVYVKHDLVPKSDSYEQFMMEAHKQMANMLNIIPFSQARFRDKMEFQAGHKKKQ